MTSIDLSDISLDDLPPKLAEIAECIGLMPALELAVTWPGVRLFVPKQMDATHPIAVQIGIEAATQLSEYCGGTAIVPPRAVFQRLERARLKDRIVAEFEAGATASALARQYDVHEITIYRWAARSRTANSG